MMNVPPVFRSKLVQGISLLGLLALVGIGYYTNKTPLPDMSSKSYFELQGIAEPLLEEIFRDKHGRALEAYKSSKGFLSCDEVCQVNKRRLEETVIELTATLRERMAARRALQDIAREERQAITQKRQAEAEARRSMTALNNEERQAARKLARKATRDAERHLIIAAHRASIGMPEHPLTMEEKKARAAASFQKRQELRGAHVTPAERIQAADDRQAARWFEYLDEVAEAHGFENWHHLEQYLMLTSDERIALRQGNVDKNIRDARSDIRVAARTAMNYHGVSEEEEE